MIQVYYGIFGLNCFRGQVSDLEIVNVIHRNPEPDGSYLQKVWKKRKGDPNLPFYSSNQNRPVASGHGRRESP